MYNQLIIRAARQQDKEDILQFCKHTFDWGDYIPDVWDRWLREQRAQMFSAIVDNKPVGIMRVSMQKPGEAWLQAARTHPKYRRKGIAAALTNTCLRWAKSKGAKIVRLSTDSDNHAAQKTLEKLGFKRISDFVIMKCEKLQDENSGGSRWAQKGDTEKTWRFVTNSEIFKESGELYTISFMWMSLDRADLAKFIGKEKAIIHDNNGVIDGLVLADETIRHEWEGDPIQVCYIDGTHETISSMMKFLKAYAYRQGITHVYAFACNSPILIAALLETGFSREEPTTELVYYKKITS